MASPHRHLSNGAIEHELKSWPQFFEPMLRREKTFEIRINDRDFKVGDMLYLREWDPETEQYTGRDMFRRVTYILGADMHCAVSPVAINKPYVVIAVQ